MIGVPTILYCLRGKGTKAPLGAGVKFRGIAHDEKGKVMSVVSKDNADDCECDWRVIQCYHLIKKADSLPLMIIFKCSKK